MSKSHRAGCIRQGLSSFSLTATAGTPLPLPPHLTRLLLDGAALNAPALRRVAMLSSLRQLRLCRHIDAEDRHAVVCTLLLEATAGCVLHHQLQCTLTSQLICHCQLLGRSPTLHDC